MLKAANRNKSFEIWLMGLSALALLPLFLASFKFFPFNNGWWPAFNYFEMNGLEMYRDFNTVYPPAFTKFLSILHNASFSPAISLSAGIFRCYLLFGLLVFFFSRFSGLAVSSLGAFLIVFTQAKSTVFIPDDYHVFQRTIFVALLLALWFLFQSTDKVRQISIALGIGILSGYLLLAEQNVGLLTAFGLHLAVLRGSILRHNSWWALISISTGFLLGGMIFLHLFAMSLDELYNISFGNDSKGNLITISTNIIAYAQNSRLLLAGLILAPVTFFIIFWMDEIIHSSFGRKIRDLPAIVISFLTAISVTIVTIALLKSFSFVISVVAIWAIIVISLMSFISRHKILSMIYPLGGLVYANSMTSGLVDEMLVLIAVPVVVILLGFLERNFDKRNNFLFGIGLLAVILSLSIQSWTKKFGEPYSWWGYKAAPISESVYTPPYELLRGITVDVDTHQILQKIKSRVEEYSESDRDVYFYPHLAFFYILHDKLPPTKSPIQWFDVISNSQMQREIEFFEGDGAKLLVMFDSSKYAYEGHLRMKKALPQYDFIDLVNKLIAEGKYRVVEYKIYPRGLESELSDGLLEKVDVNVVNSEYDAMSVGDALSEILGEGEGKRVTVSSVSVGDRLGARISGEEVLDHVLNQGDVVEVSATPQNLEKLIKSLGFVDKFEENWYSLKILVKR